MTEDSTKTAQNQRQQQHNEQTVRAEQDMSKVSVESKLRHNCDILLNNFSIGKRRYRVLLHYNHIVWELLNEKRAQRDSQPKTKKECAVEAEQLSHKAGYSKTSKVVHVEDIITVKRSDFGKNFTGQAEAATSTAQFLSIQYAVRVVKSATDCNRWRVRSIIFFNSDANIVQKWYSALHQMLSCQERVQRLLVFINPYGGRQQGLQIYERFCKPLFTLASIDASCIVSQRPNQIRDIILTHDLTPYDAVCCVGGDGTVAEVINGLIFRSIRDHDMDMNRPDYIPKPKLPIAIIPAGSTDTVAYSLHGTADVRTAAIHLVLGQRRGLDICSVQNGEGILRFCASVFSYGYLGDVAAKSEKYRWMGTKRYEYTGVKAFLMNHGYEAELHILLPKAEEPQTQQSHLNHHSGNVQSDTPCFANCETCNAAKVELKRLEDHRAMTNHSHSKQNILTPNNNIETNLNSPNNERCADKADEVDNIKYSNNKACDKTCVIDKQFKHKYCKTMQTILSDGQQKREQQQVHRELMCGSSTSQPRVIVNDNNEPSELTNINKQQTNIVAGKISEENNIKRNTEQKSVSCHSKNSMSHVENNNLMLEQPNMQWQVIKGSFFMISGANITCACTRSPNGISRYSHLGDGHLDLILVRKTSLLNNVRFVINTMGRNGDIRNLPFVEVYRTRKFLFRSLLPSSLQEGFSIKGSCQPITNMQEEECEDKERISSWNCDGEVIKDLDVSMSSHCQLIDVFMRGPHPYVKDSNSDTKSNLCCCAK